MAGLELGIASGEESHLSSPGKEPKSQPTDAEKQAAQAECDLGAPGEVQDAYGKIEDCATAKAGGAADGCQ